MSISYPTVDTVWTGQTGDAPHGIAADDAGNVWVTLPGAGKILKFQVDPVNDEQVALTEKYSAVDAQHPTELAFDGVYVAVTHSYYDHDFFPPLEVTSDVVGLFAVASLEYKQVMLGVYNQQSGVVVPAPVNCGPGSVAPSGDHFWFACSPFLVSQDIGLSPTMPMRLNPVSGKCSPGMPVQELADKIVLAYLGVEALAVEPGGLAIDRTGAVCVSFRVVTQPGDNVEHFTLRATTVTQVLEADQLAIRSISTGSILATRPAYDPVMLGADLGSEMSGRGAVYPLMGENDGDTVVWDAELQDWRVGPGGGGGFIADGDLTGSSVNQEVRGIRTVPVVEAARVPGGEFEVLMTRTSGLTPYEYRLARLTQDMILPGFSISSFTCNTYDALQEVGTNIGSMAAVHFLASYGNPPGDPNGPVTLRDSDNLVETDVSATPTSFDSPYAFINKNTYGDAVQFRLTATRDGFQKQAYFTITWVRRVYWFAAANPGVGGFNQAWVEANAPFPGNNALAASKNRTFSVDAGAPVDNKHIYYVYRDAYGGSQFWVNGFQGGFNLVDTISMTVNGVSEQFRVYETTQVGLGPTQVTVTD